MKHLTLVAMLLVSSLLALAGGSAQDNTQSLADFARKERARKEEAAKATVKEDALSPQKIPQGIRYKFAEKAIVQSAANRIKKVLTPDFTGDEHIFQENRIICGPFLWRYLSTEGEFGKKDSFPATFNFSASGKQNKLIGRGLEGGAQIHSLEAYLRRVLKDDGGFSVRALNPEELSIYWAEIAWDIEEPVFTIESKSHRFVMQLGGTPPTVWFIEDLQGIHLQAPAGEGGTKGSSSPRAAGNP